MAVSSRKLPGKSVVWKPTNFGSYSKLPIWNWPARSLTGESSWNRVGTEPLCRKGGVAQMPSSGRAL
ncbi:hypothetical protein D3C76_1872070 [compost metagenome]